MLDDNIQKQEVKKDVSKGAIERLSPITQKEKSHPFVADGSCFLYLPFPYLFCLLDGKKLPVFCLADVPSGAP